MKKKLPILLMSSFMLFGLVSCGGGTSSSSSSQASTSETSEASSSSASTSTSQGGQSSSQGGQSSSTEPIVVNSVEISGYSDTTVFDLTNLTLKAEVNATKGGAPVEKLKVDWSTSDEKVATVKNGIVKFLKVSEDTKVKVIATSRDDKTKKGEVEFTVKHGLINLSNSKGAELDASALMEEGTIYTEPGDTALIYSDIFGTKWYVEAEITIEAIGEDDYPKIGIMTGTDEMGNWNATIDASNPCKNAFFYCDTVKAQQGSGWTNFNFVGQNEGHTDWDWGRQTGAFSVTAADKTAIGMPTKMGLLRDGVDYYLYAMKGGELTCYKHVVYTDIAADEPTYAWIGGWKDGATIGGFKALVGDEVNQLYTPLTDFTINEDEQTLYIGTTYQVNVQTDVINYNKNELLFESSDPTVATVDKNGLVTATDKPGETTITVKYGELTKSFKVTVTDDVNFRVVLDGKMDDNLWSDKVKQNKYRFQKNEKTYIDFYGSRNNKGVYLFADYYVETKKGPGNGWWESDNFEGYFATVNGRCTKPNANPAGQLWASANNISNFDDFYISAINLDETTNLYHMVYELFVSYDRLEVTKDTVLSWEMGSNPQAGWYQCPWMGGANFADKLKVTTDGLVFDVEDKTLICPEEGSHTFGAYYTTKAPTCAEDGEEAHKCTRCGLVETRVIAKGQHTYDVATAKVTTPSTCTTAGKATVTCTTCNQPVEIDLPLDYKNHDGHDFTTGPCACGEIIGDGAPIVNENNKTSGGWTDQNKWTRFGQNLEGNFEISVDFNMHANINDAGEYDNALFLAWKSPIVAISDADQIAADGTQESLVMRMDWFGWNDATGDANGDGNCVVAGIGNSDKNPNIQLNGMYVDNFDVDMHELYKESNVNLVIKRVDNEITLNWTINVVSTGKTYTPTYNLHNVVATHVDVSMAFEYAYATFTSIRVSK